MRRHFFASFGERLRRFGTLGEYFLLPWVLVSWCFGFLRFLILNRWRRWFRGRVPLPSSWAAVAPAESPAVVSAAEPVTPVRYPPGYTGADLRRELRERFRRDLRR